MKTTITEYRPANCPRCMGAGRLSSFQHYKAGECFRCGGTGKGQPVAVERDMTDDEVVAALAGLGFTIATVERPATGDWLIDLFGTEDERAYHAEAMRGARLMLAAL